ncbi:MAG TPA: arginine deiminase-related protein [Terriglobales bacterium]|nr:arginine deiminase-related protein [Terriglobales bacterium]HKV97809.1 arginine deiminase-related protein [Gammaproteobacteria bacterium]
MPSIKESQIAPAVLMIRPARFGVNAETAPSNAFQRNDVEVNDPQALALQEFDVLVSSLQKQGVSVEVFDDTPEPWTPDAVFPGNWVSFHADGSVVLYPLLAPNRRWERRLDIIEELQTQRGYKVQRIEDLTGAELEGRFLEGTGSLVLDREHHVAYACLSPRTDIKMLREWAGKFEYETVEFHAVDKHSKAVYHTDVMMCIGDRFALLCLASIRSVKERRHIQRRLEETDHEIIPITAQQMLDFAGNALQLGTRQGGSVLAMSMRAERSLTPTQRLSMEKYTRIVSSPVNIIETCAGGSVRCMLAEIFLPRTGASDRA